jgi:zinc transporter, ZIP family
MMTQQHVWVALALTLFAGLSTGLGGLAALLMKRTNTRALSLVLGFSAGVMLYVSFVEILDEARSHLTLGLGETLGLWITAASFFGGIFLIALIDRFVPSFENPHEMHRVEEMETCELPKHRRRGKTHKLMRTGLMVAVAVTIHNLPEGLAVFTSAVSQPRLGLVIAVAIAIHNIPEGIAVSIPIYCATGSRKKAFWFSLVSGLSEPLGALIGWLVLMPIMNDVLFGVVFAGVAGIMVFISLDELLPTAQEYGEHHLSMYGLIAGMMVMAVSLLLFI